LVPLLALIRSDISTRTLLFSAYVCGFLFFLLALKWMRVAHPMMVWAWIALTYYCALYFPLAAWVLRRLDRKYSLPFTLTLPIVWTSLEFFRAHFLTGFPWYLIGIIQIADLGGVYAVSFVVLAANGFVFELVARNGRFASLMRTPSSFAIKNLTLQGTFVFALFGATIGYGYWRMSQANFREGPRVALLQTNVSQDVKNAKNDDSDDGVAAAGTIVQQTKDLTDTILREHQNPDLIIWPETTCTEDWLEAAPGTPLVDLPTELPSGIQSRQRLMNNIASYSQAHVLLGLNTYEFCREGERRRYNSALLVCRDGKDYCHYDKMHRVLFGEYVPFRETMPWLQTFTPYDHDYSLSEGENWTHFRLPTRNGDYRFGALICYEDSVSSLARHYAREDDGQPPVDFLVNMSNDGWFRGTEEHEEHLAVCRFRAVETRRAVARSVNMGISAIIDGNGRVTALPRDSWSASKKVAAAFTAAVPIDNRRSWYARVGDWFAASCAIVALAGLVGTFARRRM
jgi:apolipoprotein N-acyltransferase